MNKIDYIVNNINENMEITQNKMLKVNDISKNQMEVVNNTIRSSKKIMKSSEEIVCYIKNIDGNIELLNYENNIVSNSIEEVRKVTSNFNSTVRDVNEIIEEEYMQTKSMEKLIEILEETIKKLQDNINRFNIC